MLTVDLDWEKFWALARMVCHDICMCALVFDMSGLCLAVVYQARNIINDGDVAVKLEPVTNNSSSLEHEYLTLKRLEGGVGIPRALWFGRESQYHALVLDLLGPSLHDVFLAQNRKFSLHTVLNIGDQLVGFFAVDYDGC